MTLADKSYLHIFKDGIAPLWEDPQNVNGGHFKLTALTVPSSLKMWQTIVLHMIGGLMPYDNCITGASIVVHGVGNNLIKIWLATADKETVANVRDFLIKVLDSEDYVTDKVTFVPHKLVLPSSNLKAPKKSQPSDEAVSNGSSVSDSPASNGSGTTQRPSKRRSSRDSDCSDKGPAKKHSFRIALTSIEVPFCCGPSQVRFAHDPYSLTGGCTYISMQPTSLPSSVACSDRQ